MQAIFDSLDKLVQTSVGDVKDVALNQTGWKDFVNHKAFKEADIPWPPTNTPDAKSVRRAGVLCICAWALELHIFQSCHLVDNDNQLSEILDELADENPDSEPHIRSILLRLQQERKTDSPYTRVDLASEAVSTYIRPLMADAEVQAVFNSSLKNIFMDACKLWREVQKLKPKITASMDESDGEDWALVSLRRPLNTKKLTQTPNGNSRVDGDATNKSSKKPSAIKVNVVPEDIMIVLWPAFLITENGKTKTLMKGYAVSEPELAAARAEAHASRRAARQNNRMVNPRRRSSISQSNGKANDGPPFLSQGGESG